MNRIPIRNEQYVWRNLDGEGVLLNPETGKYFGVNTVGCSFWEQVDGEKSMAEIATLLLEEYEVDRQTLESDLTSLVETMVEKGLISFR